MVVTGVVFITDFFPTHRGVHGRPRSEGNRKARAFAEKRRALSCGLRALPRPGHPAGGVRSRSAVAPAGTSAGRLFRVPVPSAWLLRFAQAPGPPLLPGLPAIPAPPLKTHEGAAARVAIPRARVAPSVAQGVRPCRACAEHTPFFTEKAFDFHRLRPSQHALPLSGIIPDKRGKRPDIPLLQHGGITA